MWKDLAKKSGLLICLTAVIGLIFMAKNAGWLQSGEWMILDLFFRWRPQEPIDKRIVIINYTEDDIKKLGEPQVSDRNLAILLNKVKQQNPVVIGLDIIRDKPVGQGYKKLAEVFSTTPNLIGIQKVGLKVPISPPPILKELGQISTVDTFFDGDRKVRRSSLYSLVEGSEEVPHLGLALAFKYLGTKKIDPQEDPNEFLKLDKTTIFPLQKDDGGYSNIDAGGYQILTNYRGSAGSFATVTFTDVITDKVPLTLMTDRIVLIGVSAESSKDFFFTPYSQSQTTPELMTGVELIANITSQIIAAVLDDRALFTFVPDIFENLGTLLFTISTFVLIWVRKPNFDSLSAKFLIYVTIVLLTLVSAIFGLCYLAFLYSLWLPVLFPTFCVLGVGFLTIGFIYINGIQVSHNILKQKNKLLQIKQVELENSCQVVKQTSLDLEKSERNLIMALDAAITGIWNWDLKSGDIHITHNCSALLGINEDNLTTNFTSFLERVHPEDCERLKELIDKSINDALKITVEFQVFWHNGVIHWLALLGKVNYDPVTSQAISVIGTISNVTHRRSIEDIEAGYFDFQKALVQNSFEVRLTLDVDFVVLTVSKSITRILGYEYGDIEGRIYLEFIHHEDINFFINSIKEKLVEPKSTHTIEYKFKNKDGKYRNLESVIYNELQSPSINAYVVNFHDITEYKEIKNSLREIEDSVQRLMENKSF